MTETPHYNPIKLGAPGEDISKKDLHAVIKRFKHLNQLRINRVQDFLLTRQQVFLEILPLLFHQNHPLLPGFISSETPAGIPDYKPDKFAIRSAKQFSKSFTYKRKALLRYSIHGIFLMGSVSSIAFSKTSDMDIWLCHQPGLDDIDLIELQQKATAIEKWAESLDLEVHFFLIDSEQFVKGENIPISDESSGNTQHYLLLEEFYRTAIYIAGKIPAWWLVPPHQEYEYSNYINHLIENRFISSNEVIDFGGLETIPAEEFISATLWHIYKSLNSPHKSLLKLLLMESYANEYPQPNWLSFDLKNAIYQGKINIDNLDPYLLIYAKVEKYLRASQSVDRQNLTRQCFYLKIMGSSNKSLDYKSRSFREEYMQNISRQWDWPDDFLPALHKHKFWDISKAIQEHNIIRTQLKHCLRTVLKLAGQYVDYNYRENQDLKLISRKLHTFLEKKPRKIEIITTRSTVHTKESTLTIVESINQNNTEIWTLYTGAYYENVVAKNTLVKQEYNLLNLLGWIVINGLYYKQQLNFYSGNLSLSTTELHQILDQISKFFKQNLNSTAATLEPYQKQDNQLASLIFINLGQSLVNERDDGMLIVSERSDPLSYGVDRDCFVQKVDEISISSWGEITTFQYTGLNDFFRCITGVFNNCKHPITPEQLKINCYTATRGKSIIVRTESIFSNLINFFSDQNHRDNNRYIIPGEHDYFIFQQKNKTLHYWQLESVEQIIAELAKPQDIESRVHFDSEVLESTLIPYVYSLNKANIIQLFYMTENENVSVFIIDEKGALFTQEYKESNYNHVLNHYSEFLESILNHQLYRDDVQLKYYEIVKNSAGALSTNSAKWSPSPTYLDLSIRIATKDLPTKAKDTTYYVYCNDIEFNSIEYGSQLFPELAKFIHDFRSNHEDYPIHISDIDAPCSYLGADNEAQLQTIHFLNYKKKIEAKINHQNVHGIDPPYLTNIISS